jgi:hypothetical protein
MEEVLLLLAMAVHAWIVRCALDAGLAAAAGV